MLTLVVAATLLVATTEVEAQSDNNLRNCLDGHYPALCDKSRLTSAQRKQADEAERRANLGTCLSGKYPSLCNHGLLTPEEQRQVEEAERRENLGVCIAGKYLSLCNHGLLTREEAERVAEAERAENRRTCLTGQYPSLCNHGLLTAEEKARTEEAEKEHAARTKAAPAPPRRPSRAASTACEDGHWVSEKLGDGAIIRLEDNSLWEIDSSDTVDTTLWLPTENVIVCSGYLINTDSGDKVDARRIR